MQDGKSLIMCVDDDQDLREGLRLMLEAKGYAVAECASAEEAIENFESINPEFVLVDMMMETVDAGLDVARHIKSHSASTPVVMLSNVGDSLADNVSGNDVGLDGVLQKPVGPDQLFQIIEQKLA